MVIHDLVLHEPVRHRRGLAIPLPVHKPMAAEPLEVSAIGVVVFEVERSVENDREDGAVLVDPPPTKHRPAGDAGDIDQQVIDDVVMEGLVLLRLGYQRSVGRNVIAISRSASAA